MQDGGTWGRLVSRSHYHAPVAESASAQRAQTWEAGTLSSDSDESEAGRLPALDVWTGGEVESVEAAPPLPVALADTSGA